MKPREHTKTKYATYFIKVTNTGHQSKDESGMASVFRFTFSLGSVSKELKDAIPVTGTVKSKYYSYYSFIYGPGDKDIHIQLTAIAGDPEIMISLDNSVKFPTKGNSEIISNKYKREEKITIKAQELPDSCRKAVGH